MSYVMKKCSPLAAWALRMNRSSNRLALLNPTRGFRPNPAIRFCLSEFAMVQKLGFLKNDVICFGSFATRAPRRSISFEIVPQGLIVVLASYSRPFFLDVELCCFDLDCCLVFAAFLFLSRLPICLSMSSKALPIPLAIFSDRVSVRQPATFAGMHLLSIKSSA